MYSLTTGGPILLLTCNLVKHVLYKRIQNIAENISELYPCVCLFALSAWLSDALPDTKKSRHISNSPSMQLLIAVCSVADRVLHLKKPLRSRLFFVSYAYKTALQKSILNYCMKNIGLGV